VQDGSQGLLGGEEVLQGLIFLNLVEICSWQVSYNREGVAAVDHYRRLEVALRQDHGAILKAPGAELQFAALAQTAIGHCFPPKTRTLRGCTAGQGVMKGTAIISSSSRLHRWDVSAMGQGNSRDVPFP